ncbi:MAG: rod shape-determining protein MreD [Flavobacteriaceae bacterium]|nr:rod shape-determining protein MreD [Flavobacteriaceae bacterium]
MLNRILFINIFNLAVLVLVQIFVFNNMYFFHRYAPLIYIVWIIFYPYKESDNLFFLIFSFILGLSVDLFMDTGGVNAFASVLIAQIRNPLIRSISGLQKGMKLFHFSDLNFMQFVIYVFVMVLVHHLAVSLLEGFKFSVLPASLQEMLITSVFSFLFIVIIYVFLKNKIN